MPADRRHFLADASMSLAGLALAGCAGTSPERSTRDVASSDTNAAYRMAYAQVFEQEYSARMLSILEQKQVLLVPGFLAQLVQIVGISERIMNGFGPYFGRQQEWLKQQSIAHQYVELNSQNGVEDNARGVTRAIEAAQADVVLVTHSKGCLDSLAALVGNPGLRRKVAAWVAIQGPFLGAPLADVLTDNKLSAAVADFDLRVLGGSRAALNDMRRDHRKAYHDQHAQEIAAVLEAIPTICYGSYMVEPTLLLPANRVGRQFGEPENDGLVSPASARLKDT